MKKQHLALFIAIVVPVAFFVFFDHCDVYNVLGHENRPKLKRYFALEAPQANSITKNDTLWQTLPPFEFDGHSGEKVNNATFKDKIIVADFFFANCPGICPKLSSQFQRIQTEFKEDDEIRLLSHTVDPERDTVEALRVYADMFEADSSKWKLVTGDKKELYEIARKGYKVSASEGDGGAEDFIHTEKFVLVDRDQIIRGYYDGTDTAAVNQLMIDIRILQLENHKSKRKEMILDRERSAKEKTAAQAKEK